MEVVMEDRPDGRPAALNAPLRGGLNSERADGTPRAKRTIAIDRDDEGLMFVDRRTGDLHGAFRIAGETYQSHGIAGLNDKGGVVWRIDGVGSAGATLSGRLFQEVGGQTPQGKPLPHATGDLKLPGGVERRMAGWSRDKGHARFFSIKLTRKPGADGMTLPLPFDLPAAR
jgi:hypothetical protein